MENEDRAEEGQHGDVFGETANENVSGAEFLVGGKGLAVNGDDSEKPVERRRHGDRTEDDEE